MNLQLGPAAITALDFSLERAAIGAMIQDFVDAIPEKRPLSISWSETETAFAMAQHALNSAASERVIETRSA